MGGPQAFFVLPPDHPAEVDAPGRQIAIEVQRAEGDLNLGAPPRIRAAHARQPDAVPGAIDRPAAPATTSTAAASSSTTTAAPATGRHADETVTHCPSRIDLEKVARATV